MRRTVVEWLGGRLINSGSSPNTFLACRAASMGGGGSVEVLEALAALRLAAKQMRDAMERFAERQGLSESRLRVLMRLYNSTSRQLSLEALAEVLNVTPRTMTDLIDVLERDGLVNRAPDPVDRRSVLAVMTEPGNAPRRLAPSSTRCSRRWARRRPPRQLSFRPAS